MKQFAAYYPGVYTYANTTNDFHPWFPTYNQKFSEMYFKIVNMFEWEGVAGQPAKKGPEITWDYLAEFDVRQTDSAVEYIKQHAKDDKPFFMDVNFMKMHNPNNPAKAFLGKSHSGATRIRCWNWTDNIGRIMDAIRAEAPDTIVIITADNGAWQDAYPDAGTDAVPRRERLGVRRRLPRAGRHVVAGPHSRRAGTRRDDVAHRLLVHAGHHGRPHPAAASAR